MEYFSQRLSNIYDESRLTLGFSQSLKLFVLATSLKRTRNKHMGFGNLVKRSEMSTLSSSIVFKVS